jgi:putative MATE family efflux protein
MSSENKNKINMLEGSIAKSLLLFAIPIAISNILQQLFNSADTAVVGHFVGGNALAAVGANSPVVSLFVYIITGLALGANVYIARLIGEKKNESIVRSVHTSMCFSVIIGVALMAVGIIFSSPILTVMGTPADVLPEAVVYLRIYSGSIPFLMIYNFGSGILRSVGDTKRPMYALIVAGLMNIVLNLFFVIVVGMGVSGVAVATLISNVFCAAIVVWLLMKEEYPFTLNLKALNISKAELSIILKIGVPAALQSSLFCISNIVIQTGINSFGSDAMAGASVGLNFELFAYYVISGFAQAVVTFTSQNYGAGNKKRCDRILIVGIIEGMGLTAALSLIFAVTKDSFVLLYTTDQAIIGYAVIRIMLVAAFEALTGTYELTGAAIRGLGSSLLPALLTVVGTVGFRIIWVNTVFVQDHSFTVLFLVYIFSWIITGTLMTIAYFIYRKKAYKIFTA